MRYDREMRHARRTPGRAGGEWVGRGEYGAAYEAPYRAGFHGYAMGYLGGALRSRGSYQAGQLRSGLNPVDEFEFEWGEGYVGGRGYGGTNYDYEHGYQSGAAARSTPAMGGVPMRRPRPSSPATRAGYSWSEHDFRTGEPYGPARYGYGPYYERLRRRRRSDEEIRKDVEEALFYDTWVDADRITVEVENGIVTLRGTLPSYDEIRYATEDAWDVDGVRGVRTELKVEEPEARPAHGEPVEPAARGRPAVGPSGPEEEEERAEETRAEAHGAESAAPAPMAGRRTAGERGRRRSAAAEGEGAGTQERTRRASARAPASAGTRTRQGRPRKAARLDASAEGTGSTASAGPRRGAAKEREAAQGEEVRTLGEEFGTD